MYDDFTITFTDSHDDVVELAVAGELDPVTAPALSEALQVVARRGATIVANMAAVTFIDSRALKVLLDTHQALTSLGGRLCLADPSPSTRRLLELTGLRDHFAAPPPDVRRADVVGSERRLRRLISELAGLVLGATSLRDDLEQLIRFSCQVLPGCDAGSITLLVDGSPTTVAVHERAALELDMIQYDNGEGPCLTALTGQRIRVDIVPVDERFPHFAARAAADHRINSVLSTPIVHRDEVVGSLNFYSYEPHAFDATAEDITVLASSQAAHAITRSEVFTAARQRRDQLQAHYDETVLVARAQGALIATHQCSAEQARTLIHDAAAATGDDLVTVAHRILDAARRHATSSSTHIAASRPDPSDDHDRSDPGSSQHRRDDGSAAD